MSRLYLQLSHLNIAAIIPTKFRFLTPTLTNLGNLYLPEPARRPGITLTVDLLLLDTYTQSSRIRTVHLSILAARISKTSWHLRL